MDDHAPNTKQVVFHWNVSDSRSIYIYIYYMFFLLRGVEDERMQEDPGFGEKFQMNETLNILVRHLLLVAMHLFQWQDSEFM